MVYLRLEICNGVLTWTKPNWSSLSSDRQDWALSYNIESGISPGVILRRNLNWIGQGECIFKSEDDGFLELSKVKHVFKAESEVDSMFLTNRRFGLEGCPEAWCITLIYGSAIADNRALEFLMPPKSGTYWYTGLNSVVEALKKEEKKVDLRVYWLKHLYLQLYYDNGALSPSFNSAIKVRL